MATLHFVTVTPGAGKTTLAQQIAATQGAVLFLEDEWLVTLYASISSLAQFADYSQRVRSVIAPLAINILQRGTSVVFDFAVNTERDRGWVRSNFRSGGADHLLYVLETPAEECRRRVHARNIAKPLGLYYGDVSDATFDAVLPHISPPSESEEFTVVRCSTSYAIGGLPVG